MRYHLGQTDSSSTDGSTPLPAPGVDWSQVAPDIAQIVQLLGQGYSMAEAIQLQNAATQAQVQSLQAGGRFASGITPLLVIGGLALLIAVSRK